MREFHSESPRQAFRWTSDQLHAFSHLAETKPALANRIFVSRKVLENAPVLTPELVEKHRRMLDIWGFLPTGMESKLPQIEGLKPKGNIFKGDLETPTGGI